MWIPCDQEEAEEVALQSTAQLACGGVSQGRGDPQWMHGSVIPPMGNAILETASGDMMLSYLPAYDLSVFICWTNKTVT